jgi:hypothetical protein
VQDGSSGDAANAGGRATTITPQQAFEQWQREAGYDLDSRYESLTQAELERLSKAGDPWASQTLGTQAWGNQIDREAALAWFTLAVEQGSIAAATYASMMFDPMNKEALTLASHRLGKPIGGDRDQAYVWARVAAMRGDRDGIHGVARHSAYYSPEELGRLENMAFDLYRQLQLAHVRWTGRAFINIPSVDPNPVATDYMFRALSRSAEEEGNP